MNLWELPMEIEKDFQNPPAPLSKRSRIQRADFMALICRSRARAAERVAWDSDQTRIQGAFSRWGAEPYIVAQTEVFPPC